MCPLFHFDQFILQVHVVLTAKLLFCSSLIVRRHCKGYVYIVGYHFTSRLGCQGYIYLVNNHKRHFPIFYQLPCLTEFSLILQIYNEKWKNFWVLEPAKQSHQVLSRVNHLRCNWNSRFFLLDCHRNFWTCNLCSIDNNV